jgi:hypothetical protein
MRCGEEPAPPWACKVQSSFERGKRGNFLDALQVISRAPEARCDRQIDRGRDYRCDEHIRRDRDECAVD